MTCSDFENLILDEMDGCVSEPDRQLLTSHLAACDFCRCFQAEQLSLDATLSALAALDVPSHFTARVLQRTETNSIPTQFLAWLDVLGLAATAAAVLFAFHALFPDDTLGLSWAVAALVFSCGAWLVFDGIEPALEQF